MANGRLGASDLAATTNTSVYTVTTGKTGSFSVSLCNRNAVAVKVRLALAAAGTPIGAEYLEYDAPIPANGVLERTGLVLDSAKIVVAYSDTANVSAVVTGYED